MVNSYLKEDHGFFPEGGGNVDSLAAIDLYAADRRYNLPKIKELLNDGYIECNETNLTKYAYGFVAAANKEIDDINVIFREDTPSNYNKEDFEESGYNLEINKNKKKL